MTPAVDIKRLYKSYDDVKVLKGISFAVAEGSITGILGANGAGKTTLINILATLQQADAGSASICGHDVSTDSDGVRKIISLAGQFTSLDQNLTGTENLVLFGRLQGLTRAEAKSRAAQLLEEFGLSDAADRVASKFSGGMSRRLDIACSLMVIPEILILDEPTTGLDPRGRRAVWELIRTLGASGVTILLTSQYLDEVDFLSDHVIVINDGKVIADGTVNELKTLTGPPRCVVRPLDAADLLRCAELLAEYHPEVDLEEGSLTIHAGNPAEALSSILATFSASDIEFAELGLYRPSLDDVFLVLTKAASS